MRRSQRAKAVAFAAALSHARVVLTDARGLVPEHDDTSRAFTVALDALSEALRDGVSLSLEDHGDRAAALAFFVEVGSDKEKAMFYGRLPVLSAVKSGNTAALELLIEAGCDVNAENPDGWTPALLAAQEGHAAALKLLIKAGCDVDVAGQHEKKPAHLAAACGHTEALELLIKAGCDVNAANRYGWTPACTAADCGHEAALAVLINAGCDVKTTDEHGATPCHFAAIAGRAAILDLLIKAGSDVNAAERNGCTPAFRAAESGHAAVLELLIEAGCDVNAATTDDGRTPASAASYRGHPEALKVLIKAGCDIHSGGVKRPLRLAARRGRLECVRALMVAGAALVLDGELVEDGELAGRRLEREMAPELLCQRAAMESVHDHAAIYAYSHADLLEARCLLRTVRLAGGWRSYVTEQRRILATLMELWKRQRRVGVATPLRRLTRSRASQLPRGGSSAPSHDGASGDVAVLSKVFELPSHVAGRILRFYTDLVLFRFVPIQWH